VLFLTLESEPDSLRLAHLMIAVHFISCLSFLSLPHLNVTNLLDVKSSYSPPLISG